MKKKHHEEELSPWHHSQLHEKTLDNTHFPIFTPIRSNSEAVKKNPLQMPKKMSAILYRNHYDLDFSEKKRSSKQKSFELKKQLELHKIQIQKCISSNKSLFDRIKFIDKAKNNIYVNLQELTVLEMIKKELQKQSRDEMFNELHEKYEHLFPNIHGNKNLIHRKKITRKKLNDLILPLDS